MRSELEVLQQRLDVEPLAHECERARLVAKPVDVDDADVTIYADPGAAPDIPGLTPHVHEYAQPNLGETGVFSVFDDAYKDEE